MKHLLDYIYSNFNELNERIVYNIRKKYSEEFTSEKICMYYYNLFSNLSGIEKE